MTGLTIVPGHSGTLGIALRRSVLSRPTRVEIGFKYPGKTIGIIVDAVSEVLRISPEQIAAPPPTVAGLGQEYLTGLVKLEKRLLIMLDIDKILSEQEVNEAVAA